MDFAISMMRMEENFISRNSDVAICMETKKGVQHLQYKNSNIMTKCQIETIQVMDINLHGENSLSNEESKNNEKCITNNCILRSYCKDIDVKQYNISIESENNSVIEKELDEIKSCGQNENHMQVEDKENVSVPNGLIRDLDYQKCKLKKGKSKLKVKQQNDKKKRQRLNKKWKPAPREFTDFKCSISLVTHLNDSIESESTEEQDQFGSESKPQNVMDGVELEKGNATDAKDENHELFSGETSNLNANDSVCMILAKEYEIKDDYQNDALDYFYSLDYHTIDKVNRLDGQSKVLKERRRKSKKWKKEKAYKQVKTKYCKSVKNNVHGKSLYVHHRVLNLMDIESYGGAAVKQIKKPHIDISLLKLSSRKEIFTRTITTVARAQPRHALNSVNTPRDLDTDLISILINIQHREITPEDFDLLLRLDESVAPKTISKSTLDSFCTDIARDEHINDVCSVCLDNYVIGQQRKYLPCGHIFHSNCIDNWLSNASRNCPLDGMEV